MYSGLARQPYFKHKTNKLFHYKVDDWLQLSGFSVADCQLADLNHHNYKIICYFSQVCKSHGSIVIFNIPYSQIQPTVIDTVASHETRLVIKLG